MMEETIRQINNDYSVTSDGRVVSTIRGKVKELKTHTMSNGGKDITLMIDGRKRHFIVSYLVAEAFIPNPKRLPNVIHKDKNISNNNVENLEWSYGMDGH